MNDDIEVQDIQVEDGKVSSIEINYNNLPVRLTYSEEKPAGLITGHNYKKVISKITNSSYENKSKLRQCLRTTIITKKPLLGHGVDKDRLATFIVPP